MGLIHDLGNGPVALDTPVFIHFVVCATCDGCSRSRPAPAEATRNLQETPLVNPVRESRFPW